MNWGLVIVLAACVIYGLIVYFALQTWGRDR